MAGSNVIPAIIGFIITAVGIPIFGVAAIGATHSDGLQTLSSKVSKGYGVFFTCLLYLTIGPLFAIPRCATTSFTTGVTPMTGAKVDGRIVPIDYQVKTGEIVDVLTSSQPGKGPSRDWLKIVKTSEARSKIRNWFKKERRDENIAEGKAEVEREFRRSFIRLPDDEMKSFLQRIAERQHFDTVEDFYAAIGYGGVSLIRMMPHIKDEYNKIVKASAPPEIVLTQPKKRVKSSEGVIVEGIDNCLVKFSRCCNPLPGDSIIGFITRGHGVSIHTRDCSNVPKDLEHCGDKDRWINAYWDSAIKEDFRATLMISCLNRVGMLADISVQLANMHVMINDINTRNFKDGRSTFSMTITVSGIEHLKSVAAKIERIDGVLSVERAAT